MNRVVMRRMATGARRFLHLAFPPIKIEFPWQQYGFVVGSKAGLYLCSTTHLKRVLRGCYYGITFTRDTMLCFESMPEIQRGRIRAIDKGGRCRTVIGGLSHGCHQIDFWNNCLYIMDTYNNAVKIFDGRNWSYLGTVFPVGALKRARASKNYGHMNSIIFRDNAGYVICHNETEKTGNPSELLVCDADLLVKDRILLDAKNAHNIAFYGGRFLICDSGGRRLIDEHGTVVACTGFTRGLAISDGVIAIGVSAVTDRESRPKMTSGVHFFRRDFTPISSIAVPGDVQEIRTLFQIDYGLSAFASLGI